MISEFTSYFNVQSQNVIIQSTLAEKFIKCGDSTVISGTILD